MSRAQRGLVGQFIQAGFRVLGAVLLVGCQSAYKPHHGDIEDHVITINRDGLPVKPVDPEGPPLGPGVFGGQIDRMFKAMDAYHAARAGAGPRRILIFVHGGLNSTEESLQAADCEINGIKDDAVMGGYYPIFINWNSDLFDSYGEHVLSVTQGARSRRIGWREA